MPHYRAEVGADARPNDALKLSYLYAEKEQRDKFERAAIKWLRRYPEENEPSVTLGEKGPELLREVDEKAKATTAS